MEAVHVYDLLAYFQHLRDSDQHHKACGLDHARGEIDGRREQSSECLGNNNIQKSLKSVHSKRVGTVILMPRNAFERAAHQIPHFRRSPECKDEYGAEFRVPVPAECPCHAEVGDEEQYQLRHNAYEFQIDAADCSCYGILQRHEEAEEDSKRQRQQHCQKADTYRDPESFQQPCEITAQKENFNSRSPHDAASFRVSLQPPKPEAVSSDRKLPAW